MKITLNYTPQQYCADKSIQNNQLFESGLKLKTLNEDTVSFKALPDKTFLRNLNMTKKGSEIYSSVAKSLVYSIDSKTPAKVEALVKRLEEGYEPGYKIPLETLANRWGIEIPR